MTTKPSPLASIIMGSASDLSVMEKAAAFLDDMEIPFEMQALSAHRTPDAVEAFAKGAKGRGVKVIIAGAGMAAHLAGVIASMTTLPVIGVPIDASSMNGVDALLSIVQMPPGIPVGTVGINASLNAAILAAQILAGSDRELQKKIEVYKENLKQKIEKANRELSKVSYTHKTN
ncbi:MAG: 5-(carboxyamino)imidazole ribonucleotide mutase [Tannerellaceae bacterium]|jgi:5-(carboxyamino)imidazole ribonucleotide mutase|nr:5-(carboxyamino)imidazole ribonucleotide mutase [Tannerellaceae bacterium]